MQGCQKAPNAFEGTNQTVVPYTKNQMQNGKEVAPVGK